MKRILLVSILAAACFALLAAPALAQYGDLPNGVYVWYQDGEWFQLTNGEPGDWQPPETPIASDQEVWIYSGWEAFGRGNVQSVGTKIVYTVAIDGQVVSGPADSRSLSDSTFIPEEDLTFSPFNPSIKAAPWAAYWLYHVDLKRPGTYSVVLTETYLHHFTDLTQGDKPGAIIYWPGTGEYDPWTLVLQ